MYAELRQQAAWLSPRFDQYNDVLSDHGARHAAAPSDCVSASFGKLRQGGAEAPDPTVSRKQSFQFIWTLCRSCLFKRRISLTCQ
jgi:hypothetical protein